MRISKSLKKYGIRFARLSATHVVPDLLLMVASWYLALGLRLSGANFFDYLPLLGSQLPIFVAVRFVFFAVVGVYDIIWRYFSISDSLRLARAVAGSTVVLIALSYLVDFGRLPRSLFFIDALVLLAGLGAMRLARRMAYEASVGKGTTPADGKPVVVFGAGMLGKNLVQRIESDPTFGYRVEGFLDDDPKKTGRSVAGVRVLGTREDLETLILSHRPAEVIVAIANLPGETMRQIVQVCCNHKVQVRLAGRLLRKPGEDRELGHLRPITLPDLLNRSERTLDAASAIGAHIRGRTVLVTGAGGSIGSELCRQLLECEPASMLLLDHSEFALYRLESELRARFGERANLVPLLADLKSASQVEDVFRKHGPQVVFHAAAYKHVPLVEANALAAITNNVGGTWNLLQASDRYPVDIFVLVSTDKAVNPVGVMGATKRVCELLVAAAGWRSGRRYSAVRFGNVLGSSGSLVPHIEKQIEAGEPVTVTHAEMERFFMLIPEAVSLVLRAACLAEPGDIAILRMGDPVKIVDIARSLIALKGYTEEQIPIVFTGVRPGEKLREELYLRGDELVTEDPDVVILPTRPSAYADRAAILDATSPLLSSVEHMLRLAARFDNEGQAMLHKLAAYPRPDHAATENVVTSKSPSTTAPEISLH